jgi:hypothetical protein
LADGCEPLRLISISPPGVAAEARTNENVRVANAVRKTDRRERPACRFVSVSLVMTDRLVDLLLPLAHHVASMENPTIPASFGKLVPGK